MKIFVFTGPTLNPEDGRRVLDAVFLPPARQGSIYRAALEEPAAIGLIDGFFDHVPAVSHKEILWALSQGIHVFGGASLGALRAVELEAFGMEGVGKVFEAFRDDELDDDDEVAVAHAPAEAGFQLLSVALVDIRATLAAAVAAGILDPPDREVLETAAKELFYPNRRYTAIFERAADSGLSTARLDALRAFLPGGRVEQKKLDALAVLERMATRGTELVKRKDVRFNFEHTEIWEELRRRAAELPLEPW